MWSKGCSNTIAWSGSVSGTEFPSGITTTGSPWSMVRRLQPSLSFVMVNFLAYSSCTGMSKTPWPAAPAPVCACAATPVSFCTCAADHISFCSCVTVSVFFCTWQADSPNTVIIAAAVKICLFIVYYSAFLMVAESKNNV